MTDVQEAKGLLFPLNRIHDWSVMTIFVEHPDGCMEMDLSREAPKPEHIGNPSQQGPRSGTCGPRNADPIDINQGKSNHDDKWGPTWPNIKRLNCMKKPNPTQVGRCRWTDRHYSTTTPLVSIPVKDSQNAFSAKTAELERNVQGWRKQLN